MKTLLWPILLLCLLPLMARADGSPPKLDPKRIINESSGFLKEREPEMTAEEYALYEKVATMLTTKPEFALKLLEAMMNDKEPASPAFEFILGNAYYATGQTDRAEASYRNALKRYPTFLRVWNNLGLLYYAGLKYRDAIPCFTQSVILGDRAPVTYGLLAYCLEQEHNIIPAEVAYMQALSSDPENPDWKEGLLRIYIQGKQYGRSEWLLKELIRERPQEARFWLAYANVLLAENRKLEATAMLEASLGAGVAGTNELNLLADLYADQNLLREAVGVYRRIMVASPELGERKLINLAEMLIANGSLAEASEVLASLKSRVTTEGRVKYLQARADLMGAQKKGPEARQELEELLKLEPLNGKALLSLGQSYATEGDFSRATFAFEAASQVPDSTYRACLELAVIELKNRHYEMTVQYLEKALAIEKTTAVQDFLARVKPLVVKNS